MAGEEADRPIIIKKVKKTAGGHHGGAWKVAYADFVTAMMAFFLLMWLLNVTTDEMKYLLSNYFDPSSPKVSEDRSGAGGVLGGLTMTDKGAMTSDRQPITAPPLPNATRKPYGGQEEENPPPVGPQEEDALAAARAAEEARFEEAADALRRAMVETPELAELAKNLMIDTTPEGLRIQIVDQDGGAMFPRGSARMYEKTRRLVALIARVVGEMPNDVSVRGHTDAAPYGAGSAYTNWELSADRANATRAALLEAGLEAGRLNNVMGKADREHLVPENPLDARNRRISIILLREELTRGPEGAAAPEEGADSGPEPEANPEPEADPVPARAPGGRPIGTFRRTTGAVAFP
jgi:chemotaxis protein MotB